MINNSGKDVIGQIRYFLDKNRPEMMRNQCDMSLCLYKHPVELYNLQSRIKVYSFQPIDSDIQRDFIEVWKNIEESIRIYELTNEKHNIIIKSDKYRTIFNLNLEL